MREGRRTRTQMIEFFWRPNQLGHPRVGLVVPKYRGTAVARNLVRRRLREVLRRRVVSRMPPMDLVLRTRPKARGARYNVLAAELEQWLRSISD